VSWKYDLNKSSVKINGKSVKVSITENEQYKIYTFDEPLKIKKNNKIVLK